MLQQLREHVHGWIAGIIIGLLALTFALWGIESYLNRGAGEAVVAKVNGQEITQSQLNTAYQRLKQSLQQQSATPISLDPDTQSKLRQQALQQLINTEVLSSDAVKNKFRIAPIQLDNLIMQMPAFQVAGRFSAAQFQQVLGILGYSQQQFIEDLQNALLVNQVQVGIQSSAFGLPNEAQQALQLMNQQRDFKYAILPLAKFQKTQTVSDAAIQNYYQSHQDEFKTPEKVSIDYLELNVADLAKNLAVSDAQIQQYYQSNSVSFTKNNKLQPLAEVRSTIVDGLKKQQLQQIFSDQSQKLSDLTYTNATTLEPAANALGLKIKTTDYFAKDGNHEGVAANPQVIAAAFNEDVLKNGNNSNLIALKDGDIIVLRLKNYQPTQILALTDVRDTIEKKLQQQAARAALKQQGEKILQTLTAQNINEISKQNQLNWINASNVSRQTPRLNLQILQAAFALPESSSNQFAATGLVLPNGDFAVILMGKVIDSAQAKAPQQLQVMQNELANNYGQLEYQLYVDQKLKKSNIKIYSQNSSDS